MSILRTNFTIHKPLGGSPRSSRSRSRACAIAGRRPRADAAGRTLGRNRNSFADGSLTATWPAVSNADEYHITYTSDNGKSWTAAASPGDNYSQNSVTINNADNGKPYIVGVRAGNAHGWSGWRNSPSIAPLNSPPATPGSITVTRSDGSLTASWGAVVGADNYHVTYSSNNRESWTAAPCGMNCSNASITLNASNTKTYVVAVRAGNAYGWSGWGNSPPSAPYSTPPPPPAAPAAVNVTRVCDHTLKTGWPLSPGATGYDLNYSDNNRKSWARLLTHESHNAWKWNKWNKNKTYWFAVRARNDGGTSGWTNSAAAPPPPCKVSNLRTVTSATHGTAGGSITATWDAGKRASAYNVNHRLDGGEWERIKSNRSATSHTWSVTQSGSYLVAVQSVKDGGLSEWQNADVAWLTADGIAGTAAALTISGHTGNWYYKATTAPDNTCKGPVSATAKNLIGLTTNYSYTYTAYDDSGCVNAIASTTFTTAGLSVSNLSEVSDGAGRTVLLSDLEANGFTTGDHSSGYTLHRVVIKFRTSINPGGVLTAAIHTESGGVRDLHPQRQRRPGDRGRLHLHLLRNLQPGQGQDLLPSAFINQPVLFRWPLPSG